MVPKLSDRSIHVILRSLASFFPRARRVFGPSSMLLPGLHVQLGLVQALLGSFDHLSRCQHTRRENGICCLSLQITCLYLYYTCLKHLEAWFNFTSGHLLSRHLLSISSSQRLLA